MKIFWSETKTQNKQLYPISVILCVQNLSRHDTRSELVTQKGSTRGSSARHRRPSLDTRSDKETEYNCGTTNADTLSIDNNVIQAAKITVGRYRGRMVAIKSLGKKKLKTDGVKFLKEMKQVLICDVLYSVQLHVGSWLCITKCLLLNKFY